MKNRFCPHPSPLPREEGTRFLAPLSLREVGEGFVPLREEGNIFAFSSAQILVRLEFEGDSVHAIALSRWSRTVVKDVP